MKNRIGKLTLSAMVIALYCAIMYLTQVFAFGQYQLRLATSLYALAYLFPFLVLPLGLANMLSNVLMGGLGLLDMIGGGIAGIITAGCCAAIRRFRLNEGLLALPVALVPSLLVPVWLSMLLGVPYRALVISLLAGQSLCGLFAVLLIKTLKHTGLQKENRP